MDIKIDKRVPIPPDIRGRPKKYPWHEMGVGDSFVGGVTARSLITKAAKATGFKFTSRKIGENEFRIWRVK